MAEKLLETIMAVKRIEIAKRIKGSLMENEDWWYLCYETSTGEAWIEHEWDHMDAYNVGKAGDRGKSRHDLDEWISAKNRGYENIEAALSEAKGK
ncbi:hypothetical protein [Qipengyuania flava]|uniref:hypothetical protein n=1 Tax=Qipengyuania flava TaxID=192812 RepID=UPI00141A908E|nr:hypothetical protein [Qipengyuania flava]